SRLRALIPLSRLAVWASWLMAASLFAYATTVIASSERVGVDVVVLCVALFLLLWLLKSPRGRRSLSLMERIAAYVTIALLVYLDQPSNDLKAALLDDLSWLLLAIMAIAALIRFGFSPTRRFEVNPLDILVLFLALVVPNLPGSVSLPEGLSSGIAK